MTTTAAGRSYIDVQWRKCWSIPLLIYHHLWSKINIMSSTGSSPPLISTLASVPVLAQPLDLLVADIWICLETAFGFVFKNIYISPGFNFPYFRSSPLSISPCWMASYFPVKLPRKENHFWHCLHLKSGIFQSNVWNCVLLRRENGSFWVFENVRLCWQNKGLCGGWGTCGASSDNRAEAYICSRNPQVAKNGQQVHD